MCRYERHRWSAAGEYNDCMESTRLLGPPPTLVVIASVAVAAAISGLTISPGPVSMFFAALAALVAWRLIGVAVYLKGRELVVRNIQRTFRFSVSDVDIRARVVDPRREFYSPGLADDYPDVPTAPGDNTPKAAKWYELVDGNQRYSVDALMARAPRNHERLAFELRKEILSSQSTED